MTEKSTLERAALLCHRALSDEGIDDLDTLAACALITNCVVLGIYKVPDFIKARVAWHLEEHGYIRVNRADGTFSLGEVEPAPQVATETACGVMSDDLIYGITKHDPNATTRRQAASAMRRLARMIDEGTELPLARARIGLTLELRPHQPGDFSGSHGVLAGAGLCVRPMDSLRMPLVAWDEAGDNDLVVTVTTAR